MIGRSAQASVFSIDVCLLAYIVAHGRSALHYYCHSTQSVSCRPRSSLSVFPSWPHAQAFSIFYLSTRIRLGSGGFLLLLTWCFFVCLYATASRVRSQNRICQLAARICLALVTGRMVAAWARKACLEPGGWVTTACSLSGLPICSSRLHRTWVQQVFASTCDTVVRPHI